MPLQHWEDNSAYVIFLSLRTHACVNLIWRNDCVLLLFIITFTVLLHLNSLTDETSFFGFFKLEIDAFLLLCTLFFSVFSGNVGPEAVFRKQLSQQKKQPSTTTTQIKNSHGSKALARENIEKLKHAGNESNVSIIRPDPPGVSIFLFFTFVFA